MKHIVIAGLVLMLALALACVQAQSLRDPFTRPAWPERASEAETVAPAVLPQLRAVMVGPGRALANINGQILTVGEWFDDYQLTKVQERSVTLTRNGVKSVLTLDEASNK